MINGDQLSAVEGHNSVQLRQDQFLQTLEAYQVDDLVKYNILRYLCAMPNSSGDANYFAQQLGFHSVEWTESVLEELVEAGVLTRVLNGSSIRYRLSDRRDIQNVCVIAMNGPIDGEAIRKLAAGSLKRAKRAKRKVH